MPRSRNIKPSFFTNDELAEGNCPLGRLFFAGLWCHADYKGDLEWRPGRLKVQILPYDECCIKRIAIDLDKSGFVSFYSNGEKIFLHINEFERHQNPHINEKKKGSEIPAYSNKYRQLVDFETLEINRDLSGGVLLDSKTDPADSLKLIPNSCNPQIKPSLPEESVIRYPQEILLEQFELLWNSFDTQFGKKGAKDEARNIFLKINPDQQLFDAMLSALSFQKAEKSKLKAMGEFWESFPHVVRWLRKSRWTDELGNPTSRSSHVIAINPADEALYAKYPELRSQ